ALRPLGAMTISARMLRVLSWPLRVPLSLWVTYPMAGIVLLLVCRPGPVPLSMGRPEWPGQEGHEPTGRSVSRGPEKARLLIRARSRIHAAGKNLADDGFGASTGRRSWPQETGTGLLGK